MIDLSEYTFNAILEGMLSRIPDDLDKREGSIIYDALAPAAYEFASMYQNLSEAFDNSFISTATGEALDRRGAEMGIIRRPAVKAVRMAKFYDADGEGYDVEEGTRFSTPQGEDSRTYITVSKVEQGVFYLEDETGGAAGNNYIGDLLPNQYIDGLAQCEMVGEPIVKGSDAETDEEYRARYLYKVKNEPFDGNASQYLQWALEYPGIGKAKVFPLWNGANTVKVSVLGTDDMPCSEQLLADFQNYLDPGSQGLGNGVAPIGAKVTVSTVSLTNITVSGTLEISIGYDQTEVKEIAADAVREYFNYVSYNKTKVYYMEVGAAILGVDGVVGLTNLKLNNGTADISLGQEERPYLNSISLGVTT